jgi:3-oxoacyl-[acyl-carrier protein] reductase
MSVNDRVAVVTGGGTGIGAAVATALAATCDRLVLLGRRPDRLEAVAADLAGTHPNVEVTLRSVDLTDVPAVSAFSDWAHEALPRVDVLVNNAGSPQPRIEGGLAEVAAAWETTWRANTLSAVLVTEGLKDLLARPGGRVVVIGSFAAELGTGSPAYAAAKGALETYAVTLMRELGADGITANVVAPGFTDGTELLAGRISPERRARLLASISAGRPGTPEEIASLVAYLASPAAAFVNGQVIVANGGTFLPG